MMTSTTPHTAPEVGTAPAPAARAAALVRVYGTGGNAVPALRGVSAEFARGQLTAIMGPSGSGKSTFLHCLAGLDSVSSGTVVMVTHDPVAASYADRVLFLADGRIVDELPAPTIDAVHARMRQMEG